MQVRDALDIGVLAAIVSWDHCRMCDLVLNKKLLYSTWLYVGDNSGTEQ